LKLGAESGFLAPHFFNYAEKYGEKDREGKPNSSFKPIESFQFIKDFKPVERGGH